MKTTLRGYKQLDFTSNDGKAVKGTKLFVTFPSNGTTGEETASLFISADKTLPKLVVGSSYVADFNTKGRLLSITES
ncbi:hypothetical protein OBV_02350 [Oscillibacter valericigenes Sjm18-20]|nr:hypothetical protein OBV_02350 [Oscillibacter valericigenes Sjm18-20]